MIRGRALLVALVLALPGASAPGMAAALPMPETTTLPEARALCAAIGIPPSEPCDDIIILERSQDQTDKSLWIDHTTGGVGAPNARCLRPIAATTQTARDGKTVTTYLCHTPDEDDTVSDADLTLLIDTARRLDRLPTKTLAQHEWLMRLKSFWTRIP